MTKKVQYLVISDVHLGHPRNTAVEIIKNLCLYFNDFTDKSIFKDLDIIFFAGDLFDQLLDMENPAVYEIIEFIARLIRFAERYNITLRFLEGTPSHDRRQNRIIDVVANLMRTTGGVRWIKTLTIERIEHLDLSILYVPDEFTSSTETTLGVVKDLFKQHQIEQVDIAIMHGMFHYQMHGIPGKHDCHDEVEYLKLVRHFVNIGHIHFFTSYLRILAQGSFDRLAHGEEAAKGGIKVTIRDENADYWEFIPNKNAKIFKTIDIKTNGLEKALNQIERQVQKIPNESRVRIKAYKANPIFMALPEIRKQYPFLHFDRLTKEDEEENNQMLQTVVVQDNYNVVEIRPDNVVDLIMGEIPQLGEPDVRRLTSMLESL